MTMVNIVVTARSVASYFRQLLVSSPEWESFIFREAKRGIIQSVGQHTKRYHKAHCTNEENGANIQTQIKIYKREK